MTDLTLTPISATTLNDNFNSIEDVVNAKAELNGNSTQKFEVADAIEQTEAVNKKQLDDAVSSINSTISDLDAEIDTGLAAKLDKSDTTVTKQGNTFNGAEQLVLLNSSGQLPALDGSLLTNISAATLDTSNMPAIENSSIDFNNDINVLSGFCWDDSLTIKLQLSSTLTKQLDAAWVSGSNAGGLDAGSKAVSTWYHVFLISNGTNTDVLFSTSAVSPTMPNGYGYKRRIGSIKTDSSGNILKFLQIGNYFKWARSSNGDSPIIDLRNLSLNIPSKASPVNLTLTAPLGIISRPILSFDCGTTSLTAPLFFIDKNTKVGLHYCKSSTSYQYGIMMIDCLFTDLNSQIQYSSTDSTTFTLTDAILVNYGYIDERM